MKFVVYSNENLKLPRCCIGIRLIVDLEKEVFYWNPKSRSFERNATGCWFPTQELERMEREFVAKMISLEVTAVFERK